jgi:hypothetical protein
MRARRRACLARGTGKTGPHMEGRWKLRAGGVRPVDIARRLGVGRASVYRVLGAEIQATEASPSHVDFARRGITPIDRGR